MTITAAMVKELRELTGAGVMACKNALVETDGNQEEAIEILRKKGEATAVKKSGRIAAEGIVATCVKDGKAAIVEVNSETDFVAKNEKFQTFVGNVVNQIVDSSAADMDAFMAEPWALDTAKTVKDELVSQIAVIGENMNIRRFEKVESDGVIASYIHAGGKIGVLVDADAPANDTVTAAMKTIAMQIAAMNPQYVARTDISADELAKMKEITIDSALNEPETLPKPVLINLLNKAVENKVWSDEDVAIYEEKKSNLNYLFNFLSKEAKAAVVEIALADKAEIVENKIFAGLVEGRVSKQLKEVCLLDQTYVMAADGKQTVAKYLEEVSKEVGATVTLKKFVRFETGEGIEKKEDDFAAEVAAQAGM
jgi:elongation factor Ts